MPTGKGGRVSHSNPYAAPSARVSDPTIEIPEAVRKQIKSAWVAGCVSGVLTLGVTLVAISGTAILGLDAWSLFDVPLIFGLSYGIYRRSRACAVLMLLYFIASKITFIVQTGQANGILMAFVFAYFYWQGVVGTYAYRKLLESASTRG